MAYIYPAPRNRYRVYYAHSKVKIYIGLYDTLETAQLAYDEVHLLFTSSMSLKDYSASSLIHFQKYVSCMNFRDSGMYFKSPIYIEENLFSYYLERELVLIFDLKDLLYFSHSKIHKRGEYLYTYVGDRQESILKRFGIESHMVYPTDYTFLNGNRYDFRRANLHIINHYYGVFLEKKYNKTTYVARIYTDRYMVIGHYATETEAAIAYNKAIDLLASRPYASKYEKNVLPFLTKQEYDLIYNQVTLSKRLLSLSPQNRFCSTKKYRGVYRDQSSYRALIGYNCKRIYLGNYPTEKRAAQAYNYASLYLYGPSGYTNVTTPLVYSSDVLTIADKLHKAGVIKRSHTQVTYETQDRRSST